MSADQPLLLIFGGGDGADRITRTGQWITIAGSTDLGRLLPDREKHHRLLVTCNQPPRKEDLSGYPVIVNMITEPENNARILGSLKEALHGVSGRIVNPPDTVLNSTRDQVAQLLTGVEGLVVPRTVRFRQSAEGDAAATLASAGIGAPLILRRAGTHGGKIVGLFDSIERAAAAVEPGRDYIATEFVDFRGEDGLYRKFRIFFFGRHGVARHLLVSDKWNVHGDARVQFMAARPELIAEERALLESGAFSPAIRTILDAVRERMPLDFFGMDFTSTPAGEVVLFEANATMSFMPNLFVADFDYLRRCFAPAQKAFMELVGLSE